MDVQSETLPTDQSRSFGAEMRSSSHKTGGATRIGGSVCLTLYKLLSAML